jgi:hypothetical protein
MSRWIRFLLAIALGAAVGLFYGWVVNPVKYVDTTPDTLRIDYKSDYVLMVAEAYSTDSDLALAARRLALLGDTPPVETVREATLFAERQGYIDADVALMRQLLAAMQTWTPSAETRAP